MYFKDFLRFQLIFKKVFLLPKAKIDTTKLRPEVNVFPFYSEAQRTIYLLFLYLIHFSNQQFEIVTMLYTSQTFQSINNRF